MNKRRTAKLGLFIAVLIVIAGLTFILNSKFHFLADIIEGPYVVFQKDNFSNIISTTQPTTGEILHQGDAISTFATQGQTEDVSFSVRPNVDLGEVQLNVSDLRMGDKVIPKENIEILNLKIWDQCTVDGKCTVAANKAATSELLVQDNDQDILADERSANPNLVGSTYHPPLINKSFKATLRANSTHTFYLRIKVPNDAAGGDYSSNISFAPGNDVAGSTIKLALKVLPFVLPDSNKDIGGYTSLRVNDTFQTGFQSIGLENFKKYLAFLRQSGLTSVSITDYGNITDVAMEAKRLGFKRLIWRAFPYPENPTTDSWNNWLDQGKLNYMKAKIAEINQIGFDEFYVYGIDEVFDAQKLIANMHFAKAVHEAGGKVAAALPKQVLDINNSPRIADFDSSITQEQAKIDLPIYNAGIYKTTLNYPTEYYSQILKMNFSRSWWSTLSVSSGPDGNSTADDVFDVPKFIPFVAGQSVSTDRDIAASKYKKSLSQGTWHHIAGVWDGGTSTYKIYVDNEQSADFDYVFRPQTPFGTKLVRNTARTFIGAYVDDATTRQGIVGFHGNIARVKVYNQALTKAQIDNSNAMNAGVPIPKADYDFSQKNLTNSITAQACEMGSGIQSPVWTPNDNPFSSDGWSLNFDNGSYGVPGAGKDGAKGRYLDCGNNPDNFGIGDSMTVEAWVKLPNLGEGKYTNVNTGSIIGQTEGTEQSYNPIEKYIFDLQSAPSTKNDWHEYYYNQMWYDGSFFGDLPILTNRGLSGFYLQASGLDGYFPYGVDSQFRSSGLIYDDFDAAQKNYTSLYPTSDGGYITTREWESFRAGIDDSRYFAKYKEVLASFKSKHPTEATAIEESVNNMLSAYPYNMDTKVSFADTTNDSAAVPTPQPNSYHQANRKLVADKIVEMQNILNGKPSHIDRFNIEEGQKIKNNPYILSVKVKDVSKVSKVEYYIDNILIGTSTLPDVNGVYDQAWDTSKYHSIVKIIVYGTDGQTEELTRNTTVDLSGGQEANNPIVAVLPKTGENSTVVKLIDFLRSVIRKTETAI